MELQRITQIPIDANTETIIAGIKDRFNDRRVMNLLNTLTLNVPYRFLSPWIKYTRDDDVVKRSQILENGCLYALYKEGGDFYIVLNPVWDVYLHTHYNILVDFAYWNLTLFLQARNPNVPAISNKLIRPEIRNSLTKQHHYWDEVMNVSSPIHCIYTNNELHPKDYALDHFIPWSFVSHDLIWNLIPSDSSINSSKNNKLPDLDYYLPKMADLQHRSLKTAVQIGKKMDVLEDYFSLGFSPRDLADMSDEQFMELYERTFKPLSQIALNMGFETWKY